MYLIQILLPVTASAGAGASALFAETRAELVERFEGVTAYMRAPAQGLWTAPDGRVERDEMVMVEVVADRLDRDWWRGYAATLARRFAQEEIHVRAVPAEML